MIQWYWELMILIYPRVNISKNMALILTMNKYNLSGSTLILTILIFNNKWSSENDMTIF